MGLTTSPSGGATDLHSPGPIGDVTPGTIAGTTLAVGSGTASDTWLSPYHNVSSSGALRLASNAVVSWAASTNSYDTADTILLRDAANTLALRNSTNPQTFRICIGGDDAIVGGVIFDHFTDVASTSTDGTEDTLYTNTLAASGLSANGQKLAGVYQIQIVGHAVSTDRIRLYFAGTAIFDTGAINFPLNAQLTLIFEVIRVSSTVVRASVSAITTTATLIAYSQYTEITAIDLTMTQVLALKSISTGTNSASGDVTAKLASVSWLPAA